MSATIAAALRTLPPAVEFNIEGDPRPELLELVEEVRPDQCTLVPVVPGEDHQPGRLDAGTGTRPPARRHRAGCKALGIRVSLFVDAEPDRVRWAASAGADRVELYTEPFARAFEGGPERARLSFAQYAEAATARAFARPGVNAGHDLDLDNLVMFRDAAASWRRCRSATP